MTTCESSPAIDSPSRYPQQSPGLRRSVQKVLAWLPGLPKPNRSNSLPTCTCTASRPEHNTETMPQAYSQCSDINDANSTSSDSYYQSQDATPRASQSMSSGLTFNRPDTAHSSQCGSSIASPSRRQDFTLFDTTAGEHGQTVYVFPVDRAEAWKTWWREQSWFTKNASLPDDSKKRNVTYGKTKSDKKWESFNEGAYAHSGRPCIVCKHCTLVLVHPSLGSGNKGMANHLESKHCRDRRKGSAPEWGQSSIEAGFHAAKVSALNLLPDPTRNGFPKRPTRNLPDFRKIAADQRFFNSQGLLVIPVCS